jgi:hypothetical protein
MSAQLEGFLYFGVMGTIFLSSVAFAIIRMKMTRNFGVSLAQSLGVSLLLYLIASLWWFYQAGDGFSQVFGAMFYGIAFVLCGAVNIGILLLLRSKLTKII